MAKTPRFILGNWKMHCTRAEASALAGAVAKHKPGASVNVAIFPPFTALAAAGEALKDSAIVLGAQDVSAEDSGAFTGEISAAMLTDLGCRYVLVGHSERRQIHGETDSLVRRKAEAAIKAGLIPVVCVGETAAIRHEGKHIAAVRAQVKASLPSLTHSEDCIIAYEPVWAIGTGKTPTIAEISQMHKTIASLFTYATSGARTAILYGGSVKPAGAGGILAADGVDGVLVGGASLKAEDFGAIIAAAT